MLYNAYDDMASFSYHNTRGVTSTLQPADTMQVLVLRTRDLP
jgi:hypothetical protein